MNDKLTLKMERGRLILELPESALDLEVNGALQATYFLGRSEGPDDLRGELRKASAAHAACAMMREVVGAMQAPGDRRHGSLWYEGLHRGITGAHRVAPGPDRMHVEPEDVTSPNGKDGWRLGYAIRAALAIADGKPDPRQSPEG